MLKTIIIWVPLIALVVGWLTGQLSVKRAAITLIVCLLIAEVLAIVAIANMMDPSAHLWSVAAIVVALLAVPLAGLVGSIYYVPAEPAPVVIVAEKVQTIYDGLDEADKRRVKVSAAIGGKLLAKGFANYLRDRGYRRTSDTLKSLASLF